MPKGAKRARDEAQDYDSDGGFVENDDENDAPKKKSKKTPSSAKGKEVEEEKYWELSTGKAPRRVAISKFKDAHLINIREFYEKNDEYLPGKKGISLNIEQYRAFLKAIPEINASLKDLGIDGLDYEGTVVTAVKPRNTTTARKESKANIDATSDEEEEE